MKRKIDSLLRKKRFSLMQTQNHSPSNNASILFIFIFFFGKNFIPHVGAINFFYRWHYLKRGE